MAITGSAAFAEIEDARRDGKNAGLVIGKKEGKIAGIRLAAATVQKWAETALGEGRPGASTEGLTLEEAAANLNTIADRLEEEG